jgi:hypothetical protein
MPLKSVLSGAPGRLRNEISVSRISIDSVIDTMQNVTPVFAILRSRMTVGNRDKRLGSDWSLALPQTQEFKSQPCMSGSCQPHSPTYHTSHKGMISQGMQLFAFHPCLARKQCKRKAQQHLAEIEGDRASNLVLLPWHSICAFEE